MDEKDNKLEINATRHFTAWMAEQKASLMFTTYQTGKLFSLGLQADGRLSVFERTLARCMGLYVTEDAQTVYLSTLYQIWRYERATEAGQAYEGYDGLYIPQSCSVTGDLDVHDVVLNKKNELIFVNTLFSCLAKASDKHSFIPYWKPPFISKLAAEDRCHLNGLAMRSGKPKYVTSVSTADVNNGWRDRRWEGGVVMDIEKNEIIAEGLSMPHSPRWYKNKLWVLNSGTGEFGYINIKKGEFNAVAFCPGYLRGMTFINDYAIVGMSQPRDNKTFNDLPLQGNLKERNAEPRCGLQVIDLNTGDVVHSIRIEGIVAELYDVVVLPNVIRPMTLGFKSNEIQHILSIGE
ncbi:MAG: TIGR03032 family protein [Gammaproteobacteria bacterium]|nr:MAG: TIGR03032 family protein [Gammaproteobacteria bacterium]RKZ71937.1 MAG: TIGR03032 family protein [Gammaproteobacteria bacterium]